MSLKEIYAKVLQPVVGLSLDEIVKLIEVPPNEDLGDFAFPCFLLAKQLKKSPAIVATELANKVEKNKFISEVKSVGPYINAFMVAAEIADSVLLPIIKLGNEYPEISLGAGKTIVVDFSSPNIAKPLGIHHIRTTMIGNSISKIQQKLGYRVVRLNYLGDWGTQFGKLIVAYRNWGHEIKELSVAEINNLYVRFSKLAEENPALDEEARNWFKKLEEGNEEAIKLWQTLKEISLLELKRIYKRLNVDFDVYSGESFHGKTIEKVIEESKAKGLAVVSEGALVVKSDNEKEPPCLLLKSDGATTYQLRDIAAVIDRYDQYQFDKMLYVVAQDQALHLKQVFEVALKLGREYSKGCAHIPFGLLRFQDVKFATRAGNVILLEDVLDTAIEKVKKIISTRGAQSNVAEESIQMIAHGAIVFADLSTKRTKNVEFIWDEILNFDGDTGPYLQYSVARGKSIVRKSGVKFDGPIAYQQLSTAFEKQLILKIEQFESVIVNAAETCEPSIIANYLLALAKVCNRMIHSGKENMEMRVIQESNPELQIARTALIHSASKVLEEGLALLGISSPEVM
jgi:arginyl-tRNA synthetase